MTNDNDDTGNVIDLASRRNALPPTPSLQPIEYEVHFYPTDPLGEGRVEKTTGYLKFGPQFIAVLEGPNDTDQVTFTVATQSVQFIKKVDTEGAIQGTLSL